MSERPTQTATISTSQGAGATAVPRPGQPAPEEATQEFVPQAPRQAPPAQASLPAFPVTRRGYDTTTVDRKVSALLREKAALMAALEEARAQDRKSVV